MKRVIDIHSHILPRVDDGCHSWTEARRMLKMYEEQNVEAVICTPHYGPCGITGADVNGAYRYLRETSETVKLYLGNEALIGAFDVFSIDRPDGPRTLAGSGKLLVEFNEWGPYSTSAIQIYRRVTHLHKYYAETILAHPERYKRLREEPEYYGHIVKAGVQLQVNAYDIYENEHTKEIAQWLLKNQLVSYIGSDAHGAERRSPALQTGVQWIYDHCPEEYADAVVHDNAAKIIGGEA